MTGIRGPEPMVDAIIDKLKAGLAERIAEVNAQAADNITLATPQDADYYTAPVSQLPHAPAIIVVAGPATWTGEGQHSFSVQYEVAIYILEEDLDRQALGRRLQRLQSAITACLWDDDPKEQAGPVDGNGPLIWRLRPHKTTPGRTFEPGAVDEWRQFYLVIFQASMFEGD